MGNYQIPPWRWCPMTPTRQPRKANDPATLRCDNEPCLFHHLGICRFSCHAWQPCATHTHAAPATEPDYEGDCDTCRFVKECTPLYLPPCYNGDAIRAAKAEREKVLEWAKKHNWPTTGGHRVIGFDKLKEFLESLRGGGAP